MITVACVRVSPPYGRKKKYGPEYVERLRNMVARHLPMPHRIVCFTDDMTPIDGVELVDVEDLHLPGWWAKMAVFNPDLRPADEWTIFFDLDTVIVGDLTPLATEPHQFSICENFTRLGGNLNWPCLYGSCVMALPPNWGQDVFDAFWNKRKAFMETCPRGDQEAIQRLVPGASYLQRKLSPGFFLHYRDLDKHRERKPDACSVVIFAGRATPENCKLQWIKDAWK